MSGTRRLIVPIVAEGHKLNAEVVYEAGEAKVSVEGAAPAADATAIATDDAVFVLRHGRQTRLAARDLSLSEDSEASGGGLIRAPMHGKVLALLVEQGASVARGQRLAIIEAMKMEHTLTASIDGTVAEIAASVGAQIAEGAKVMVITGSANGGE